ncbi:1-(5-phosphoribosyl)-5-amino-4-imidazole-carboxylate carboxylase [candidate division WOR-1 bacterium DG_54_3]|uniref:1-(5-phosphoribosyl)-5-amino-4-imidazole-carboxylate carboxylase n=1 Tax=candidate division WOR-1 bacterium DG_54_3 TaxID=1703775 RepID=A0A0S7XX85_UNCSA|nr:MAG: 1-(5-phosphoribosyl)-5-amino-4-imidazole-carboxylate carboxylase [candidate division WOR-1 bacterium DG_54_3]
MDIRNLLKQLKNKKISIEEAYAQLKNLPYEDLGFAKIDHHRNLRKGFPEVIYCEGKTPKQIAKIAQRISKNEHNVLATRSDQKAYKAIKKVLKEAKYHETARIITVNRKEKIESRKLKVESRNVAIVTAGTADLPVAEEAAVTAQFLGNKVERFYDVGVAGIHRLLKNIQKIQTARVMIVVAGMEGALPSVVGGLVDKPVIAVPTSIGYGSSFKGLAALLTMLNSCAPGVSVVNIDNGFGAAVMAHTILNSK